MQKRLPLLRRYNLLVGRQGSLLICTVTLLRKRLPSADVLFVFVFRLCQLEFLFRESRRNLLFRLHSGQIYWCYRETNFGDNSFISTYTIGQWVIQRLICQWGHNRINLWSAAGIVWGVREARPPWGDLMNRCGGRQARITPHDRLHSIKLANSPKPGQLNTLLPKQSDTHVIRTIAITDRYRQASID